MIILINPEKLALCSSQSALLVSLLFSNGFEQFLSILRLTRELFLLPAGILGFLHAAELLGGVFQPQVRVSVERDADIAVTHQVLKRLRIHARLGLIAAVGMAADVRSDVGHLDPVDIIVALDHMIEPMLPVHGHFRQAVLVQKQKTAAPVDHALDPGGRPVLDDGAEALLDVRRHRELAGSGVGLGLLNHERHIRAPLELVVDIDQVMLKIDIADCQPTELRNTHTGMEQDINNLIVFAVAVVVMDEFQELLHLIPGDGFSGYAIVYHHPCKLKAEGVLVEQVIIDGHLESRSKDPAHGLDS